MQMLPARRPQSKRPRSALIIPPASGRPALVAAEPARPTAAPAPSDAERDRGDAFLFEMGEADDARLPLPNFLDFQPELDADMRTSLVRWLTDITTELRLQRQTLSIAVNLMDRYLSKRRVPRRDFQLLGIVSLFVASKYEEVPARCLAVSTVHALCCGYYTPTDVHEMERRILGALGFDLGWRGALAVLDALDARDDGDAHASRPATPPPPPALPSPPPSPEMAPFALAPAGGQDYFSPRAARDERPPSPTEARHGGPPAPPAKPWRRHAAAVAALPVPSRETSCLARAIVEASYRRAGVGAAHPATLALAALGAAVEAQMRAGRRVPSLERHGLLRARLADGDVDDLVLLLVAAGEEPWE